MGHAFEQQLNALRVQYVEDLAQKISELDNLWTQVSGEIPTPEGLKKIQLIAHSLAGSGGTFGYPKISEIATALEAEIEPIASEPSDSAWEAKKDVNALICRLKWAIEAPPSRWLCRKTVCVISEDKVFRSSLSEDVELSGYNFCSLSLIPDSNLAGVVVDLDTCDLKEARGNLRRVGVRRHQLPIIFATRKKDFDACLNVVRAGGDILISKPVTADNLIREFERIEVTKKITPFRVLIVENNSTSSSDNRIGTEQTAFVMDYLHDPERLLNKLASFHPELILVDFEFPRYTGLELARMVWQSEDFTNMPVLFKCSDYEACRKAYKAGLYDGDLLTEPLTPERFFLPLHGE